MNYQNWILEKLITKFENSKAFRSGDTGRKIAFRMQDEKKLSQILEVAEEKEQFLATLESLKQRGFIDYSWVRYEKGNLVERVWLIQEEDKIKESYHILGKVPKGEQVEKLKISLISHLEGMNQKESEIFPFLQKQLEYIEKKRSIPRFFTDNQKLNECILSCLSYLSQNQKEIQERIFSSSLYGDSKYFERYVKGKVLSVLRAIKKENGEEVSDEVLLREKGIVKWPEVLEFTGKLKVYLDQGSFIDFSSQIYGAYINSLTVERIDKIDLGGIKKVLFIENKANYIWHVEQEVKEMELVIYHGGNFSPIKGEWFKKLYKAFSQRGEPAEFYHWSDIDVGGFRIFCRLKEEIIPPLEPYQMDVKTLEKHQDKAMPMKKSYRKMLEAMKKDPRYVIFHELIERMLKKNIRLEQEQLLYEGQEYESL